MLTAPSLNYALLAPMLIIFGAALLGVLVEAFMPSTLRRTAQIGISFGAVILALVDLIKEHTHTSANAAVSSVTFDKVGFFLQGAILALSLIALLFIADRDQFTAQASAVPGSRDEQISIKIGRFQTEIFPLTLFAIGGMMLFVVASDLITLFVALEVFSLPLYLMVGLARRRRLLSQEAALKYFLLGAFSSAIFLFGAAFLYGYSGTLNLSQIASSISGNAGNDIFLIIGILFVGVGLFFKMGAAPFHSWSPDVYQGAPTPITAFMASCTKIAALAATARIFYVGFQSVQWSWKPFVIAISVISMLVGAIGFATARDVKRMIAYSSITHAGFFLMTIASLNQVAVSALLFYLVVYGLAALGILGTVTLVRDSSGEVTDINRWTGLGRRSPLFGILFSIFTLSFAGIPLTAGFAAKFYTFTSAYMAGNSLLVVVAITASAIAVVFYVRAVLILFMAEEKPSTVSVHIPAIPTAIGIAVPALATIAVGVAPQLLLHFTNAFSTFIG
jgi:NADH-quinone oxidoreductase subunit N